MKLKQVVILRRICQVFFLALFLFLLVENRLSDDIYNDYSPATSFHQDLRIKQPVTFFFQLDPLVSLASFISGHALIKGFWWGLILIVMTLFLGRFFCGFICPLGTINNAISRFRPALKGNKMVLANQGSPGRRVKYFLLMAILISALFGLNLAGLLDPISLLFRSVSLAILPGIGNGIRDILHSMAQTNNDTLGVIGYYAEELISPLIGYSYEVVRSGWIIGFIFLVILFLNRIRPRFWCRVLCPLGALLGILSRFGILRLEKNQEKCIECELCIKECQGAASPMPGQDWNKMECLVCLNCYSSCPYEALSFKLGFPRAISRGPDMGKRALLGSVLAGVSIPLLGRLDGRVYKAADPGLIRPPGSLPEKDFLDLCLRCGVCMKVCPTNVINPVLGEAGIAGFWTPRLIMDLGYCEHTCILCGTVCPTGAIKELTTKQKIEEPVRIGSAYIDRGRCLPWSGNGPCIVCEEHCPTSPKAIYLKKEVGDVYGKITALQLPYVNLNRCTGCGICENRCPVKGRAAIRVISSGESRSQVNQILLSDY